MTVYVGDRYKDGDIVYLYYYNNETDEVVSIPGSNVYGEEVYQNGYKVVNGYITYTITHCSDYFLSEKTPEELGVTVEETSGSVGNNGSEASADANVPKKVLSPNTGDNTYGSAGWLMPGTAALLLAFLGIAGLVRAAKSGTEE